MQFKMLNQKYIHLLTHI